MKTGARGVTLLEMLVALAVFGIVATVLYGTFSRTIESRDYASARTELFARARLAFDWLEQDLEGSLSVATYPAGKAKFLSSGSDLAETPDLPLLDLTVRTSRRAATLGGPRDESPGSALVDQARVVYRVEELEDEDLLGLALAADGGRPRGLVRYELRPPLDGDFDAALRTVIVRDLASIQLVFDDRGTTLDRWEASDSLSLRSRGPRTVDIRITLKDRDGSTAELTTTVLVPLGGRGG
jgi:prepilin-type N-terminal cleavage/methylation domain-containing protein